jgi:predicted transcriptional regulator YdeE
MKASRLYLSWHVRRITAYSALFGLLILSVSHLYSQGPSPSTSPAPTPVKVEDEPSFTVIGVSVRTSGEKEAAGTGEIPGVWMRAMQDGTFERIPNRADDKILAVYTDFASDRKGEYTYVLGMRVSAADKVPDGMTAITVPAGKYVVVESEKGALPEVMPRVWQRIAAMPPKELGGERVFKTDYEVFPAGFNWQDVQVEVHAGIKQ